MGGITTLTPNTYGKKKKKKKETRDLLSGSIKGRYGWDRHPYTPFKTATMVEEVVDMNIMHFGRRVPHDRHVICASTCGAAFHLHTNKGAVFGIGGPDDGVHQKNRLIIHFRIWSEDLYHSRGLGHCGHFHLLESAAFMIIDGRNDNNFRVGQNGHIILYMVG